MTDKKPQYKTYRARRMPWDRFRRSQFDKLGKAPPAEPGDPHFPAPPPPISREDAQLQPAPPPRRAPRPQSSAQRQPKKPPRVKAPRASTRRPVLKFFKWFLIWAVSWLLISGVLFVVSATIQQSKVSDSTNDALGGGGNLLTSPGNVLVMGLDERPKNWDVARSPARTDTLMLLRTGGGEAQRVSILRDSYAEIPGYLPQKINAAYAYGGAPLTIKTVENFMNVGGGNMKINHMIIVDFDHFPGLIDALGGVKVEVRQRCIRSTFDGKTFRLARGTHTLNGEQALRFSRVRKNECDPSEDDRDRAARQQQVMSSMKNKIYNPLTFVRLPWIAWAAPKAFVTDMSPFTLLNFMTSMTIGSSPKTHVLKPSAAGPGSSLIIPEGERQRWSRRLSD
ncbi:MAG: LCP family protein [Thermoleophilaceae bacterium]|nr:LCP family protein [Thermoleophilaceae bacterium]